MFVYQPLGLSRGRFSWFEVEDFVRISDALFLIGIRWANPSDSGGQLANFLLVDPADVDPVGSFHFHGHPFFGVDFHLMAVAYVKDDTVARFSDPVAHTHDLQCLGKPVRHAGYGIGDQAAGKPVPSAIMCA